LKEAKLEETELEEAEVVMIVEIGSKPVGGRLQRVCRCGTNSSPSNRAEPKTRNELIAPECASSRPRTQVAGQKPGEVALCMGAAFAG
jgi:hypothetical protein